MKTSIIALFCVVFTSLAGCTVLGAGTGAVVGHEVTGGNPVGTIGGAVVGGVIGHELGK